MTTFESIYDVFFSKITDDMYMELTEAQTRKITFALLENALPWFEFPRFALYNYSKELEEYNIDLSREEINIIATYMVVEWLGQ